MGQLRYEHGGALVHVTVLDGNGVPVACGACPADFWPMGMTPAEGYSASVTLDDPDRCQHGGTRKAPTRWGASQYEIDCAREGLPLDPHAPAPEPSS
jgi:hypothetical protein